MKTENVQEVEFKLSAFFEKTPDLVCIAGRNGYFKKVNKAVIDKLGYSEQELMARPISSFIHPGDQHLTKHEREKLLNGKVLLNFQNRYVAKSGAVIWLEWTSIYFAENEVVFAIAKDITERKQIELEVEAEYKKFKGLTSHFKSSMEEDRKYLANELHEELAHLASVLKMNIEAIRNDASELSPASKSRIEHASQISRLLDKTIRRITFSISPNMLDHLGLNATLERYCKEFSVLNGIPCHFESSYNESGLTGEIKIDLFRICQESLMNIATHAQATRVKITIEAVKNEVRLTITDDGKGFDVEKEKRKPGLIRMRERAASINGKLTIESEVGKGTKICVCITK